MRRIAAVVFDDMGQLRSSGVGFSGVLFCYAIIEANHTVEVTRSFYGMFNVPAKLMPFLLLVVLQVSAPKLSGNHDHLDYSASRSFNGVTDRVVEMNYAFTCLACYKPCIHLTGRHTERFLVGSPVRGYRWPTLHISGCFLLHDFRR
jgi:hypothetical protein